MKQRVWLAAMVAVMSLGLVFCGVGEVLAKVGGPCADCHTMHYSQDGVLGKVIQPTGLIVQTLSDGPFRALTIGGCVGCHTGTNSLSSGAMANNIPYVLGDVQPTYDQTGATGNVLAGGNFWWVKDGAGTTAENTGHNVFTEALSGTDHNMSSTIPPGFDSDTHPALGSWVEGTELTCAGTTGCHGQRISTDDFTDISGAHHSNADGSNDGTSWATSYRFLNLISGYEDDDYEMPGGSAAHNMYSGVDRNDVATQDPSSKTISAFCAQCHGNFHSGTNQIAYGDDVTSSWLRHPTDYDMGNTPADSEYKSYNTDGTTYSLEAPVGTIDISTWTDTVSVTGDGTAIVTCISCHRAHGSPYADLLRWDYSTVDAAGGDGNTGCFICHTTKDDI